MCFFWLHQGEYHIVCVDFICSSRGRIRKLRFAYDFLSGFTNAEYHIALVDFIYSSRGRLERDRGFANPLSLSNTSPDPWGDPLRRGILAAAVYANIGFLYPVQVVTRQFRILFGCLCSGWYRSRFSRVAQLVSFVFHYWGKVVCSCGYVGFCFFFRRICAQFIA